MPIKLKPPSDAEKIMKETLKKHMADAEKEPTADKARVVVDQRIMVTVQKSFTKNLEDYNSMHVMVGLTVPVDPTAEDLKHIESTLTIVNNIIDEELEDQVLNADEVRSMLTAGKK